MARLQKQKRCRQCEENTLHERDHFSDGIGCLITVITAGLFLPLWLILLALEGTRPWICQKCGKSN